ncbi:MAG: CDP-diacylglycerol--serine O-phosphatidyltransferase [Prevotellaceae bacterium]|jgi:CDP-diacylglycerol--serine O-phosphatidyltransferase|nr:CDP-diacylglycerol--serine O-phosphatidyltransferase [Prevotellaceae bacterium]
MFDRLKRNIPNALTACNLLCGCVAVVRALNGDLEAAVCCIFAAAIFDFFDGFVARLLNAQSDIGLQLDSLADVVSFGVAPSSIIFWTLTVTQKYFQSDLPAFIPYLAFLIAVFSALRLAKFNIDERQTSSFIGLPTPACAIFVCGLPYFDIFTHTGYFVLLTLIPALCFLLTCELPMFSLKLKKTDKPFVGQYKMQLLLLACSSVFLIAGQMKGLSLSIALYVLLAFIDRKRKKHVEQ